MDTPDNNKNIIQKSGNARRQTSSPDFDSSAVFASTSAESSRFYYEYSSSTESIQVIRTPAHLPENGTASTRRALVKRGQVGADLEPAAGSNINGMINNHEENAEHDTYIKQEEDDSDYYAASPNYNPTSSSFQFSPSPPPPPVSQSQSVQSVQEKTKTVPYARRALLQTARKLTLSDLESSGDEGGVGPPPEMAAHLEPGEGVSFHNSSGASGDAEEGERIETPPELSVFDKKNILGDEQDTASGEPEPAEPEEQPQPQKLSEEISRPAFAQNEDEDAELRPRAVRLVYEENFTQEELDQSILSGPKRVIRQSPTIAIDDGHDNNIQNDNELEEQQELPLQSDNQHQQNIYSHPEDTKESSSPESSKQKNINLELPEDQQQHDVLTEPNNDDEESDGDEPLIQQRKTTDSSDIAATYHKEDYNKDSQERQAHEQHREKLRQERLERERQTEKKLLHAVVATDEEFERARLELAERLARERETRERLQREEAERAQRRRETEAREQARLEAEQARIIAESQAFERRREEQRKRERELDRERERKRATDRAHDAEKAHLIIENPVTDGELENNLDKQRSRWEEDELDFVKLNERDHFPIENQKFTEKEERDQELRVAQERADREHADRERAEQDNRERRFRESNWQSAALLERQLQRESQLRTETETTEADKLYHEQVRSKQEQQQRKRPRPSLTRTPLTRNKTTPKKTFSPQSPSQRLLQRRAIYPRIGGVRMNIRSATSPAPLQLSSETTASTSQRLPRGSDVLTSSMGTHSRSTTFSSASTDPDEAPNAKRPKLILDWTSSHWRRLYRVIVNELRMSSTEITATAEAVVKTGTGIPLQVRTAFSEFDSRDIGFRLLALARTLAKNGPRARDLVLKAQKQQR